MQDFPLKTILVEYSPSQGCVFIRGIFVGEHIERFAPMLEGNAQNYVRAHQGFDNMGRALAFSGLKPSREVAKWQGEARAAMLAQSNFQLLREENDGAKQAARDMHEFLLELGAILGVDVKGFEGKMLKELYWQLLESTRLMVEKSKLAD